MAPIPSFPQERCWSEESWVCDGRCRAMRKFSAVLWIKKHSESKFREWGGDGFRQAEDDVCRISLFKQRTLVVSQCSCCTDRTPWERQEWEERNEIVQNMRTVRSNACWVFASLVWKYFASYSQDQKAQRGEAWRNATSNQLMLSWSRIHSWLKSIRCHRLTPST